MTPLDTIDPPYRHPAARVRDIVLDRAALDADIAVLRKAHPHDNTAFRKAATERFKQALEEERARIRADFEAYPRGLLCAARLATLEDDLIRAIHDYVVRYIYPNQNPSSGERLSIVAVGGYGRGTLAPGSDIDLLFLLPYKQTPWCESVVETILYVLWDLRQKVGHATRSVSECIRQAKGDMTVRTAMLEARFIDGDRVLFDDLREAFDRDVVRGSAREFVAAKLAERESRVNRAGASRYLVEPNVKEGKGGLRDLNTLFWIAKYVYRVRDVSELVAAGLFTPQELRLFKRCDEFLWCVRCLLHFITGRAEERLTFDRQRQVANELGYASRTGLSAVERFMKHYFLIAKDVGDLTAIVCSAMEEREAKPRAMLDRFMGRLRRRKHVEGMTAFAIETNRITVARPDVFDTDPVNLIRLFWAADQTGLAIHPDATRLVTLSLKNINARIREDHEANRLFLDILTSRHTPEIVLRRMNEAGVLGRFIPDFGRVVAMMQFNMYHHYTVDEHLIRTVGVLAAIGAGRFKEELPVSAEIMPNIPNRRVLYVAAFLHDIAKGRKEDHSLAGAEVARKLCPRFGMSTAETETVAWLVEYHLVMSTTAQSRDLSDPRTIETFAHIVQSLERLRLLLLLTVCDIRAVGPGVWNGWKGQLLRTLYWETEIVLTGGYSAVDRKGRVAYAQDQLRKSLPGWSDYEFDQYAQRHYPAYWLKVDLPRKIQHANLLRLAAVEMKSLVTEVATDEFRSVTELTVIAPDHPRLLSVIFGACAAAGANIVDAQIFTTNDGLALDTIFISRGFERDDDERRRADRIATHIEKALRGEIQLGSVVAAKGGVPKGRAKTFPLAPEVMIDNGLSNRYTLLEVSGLDRPGLLYDLTNVMWRLNLNIGSAHVATFGEKAVDVFYVTDLTGAKVTNATRQAAIKRHLLEVFAVDEDGKKKGDEANAAASRASRRSHSRREGEHGASK
ncbi:[protein-PII] uridylyltransferase [Methylovirgula sp. 4M-Z18]|uniref:[protein-PII] uridylyltransferase n=1 Tax=Methylovirgula sp. 4M-Z18 TaxID=2293567 RepID=UPI000E2F5BBF|nr:[protein-PII] uridylyltransferase [Methylovirgula sp. 4M-Z18]RFB79225.1 [protein-PII] uridylyltransferase [Methylovirgula sp. 4M-Z18]